MKVSKITLILMLLLALFTHNSLAQNQSIARRWNNIVLEAIRNDFARPTVHARNLYHHSIVCYDSWAAFNPSKSLFFLGQTFYGYDCQFNGVQIPGNVEVGRIEAISYASYRFIENRYSNSPDYNSTLALANQLMNELGLDVSYTSTDYMNEGAPALGNYLAAQIQAYGLTDGSNEVNGFDNQFYTQINPPLEMSQPGNPSIQDPNHWQPLSLETLIDQSGNVISTTQPHLSPEWGNVHPFALDTASSNQLSRDGMTFNVYFDSLEPAYLYQGDSTDWDSFYKWNHSLVSVWQSHLDPSDGVLWDISPASIGNNQWYPSDSSEYAAFYDLVNGGDPGIGHAINPATGAPYTPQMVSRADYARVLAEFWADGVDSETPPGHWFEIYHYVTDQPSFERKWRGVGPVLENLEYDVKAHLTLGGTMHDAAIAAWSLKGYYDYARPVSAIRYMADQGQSSDLNAASYDPNGIPLLAGFVELVEIGDPLAGQWNENVGKIKLYTWRGHEYIANPQIDIAGVGWILAENWWPYQRPTFVTPPFAGFVSGHSTFSRAAAHTMEFMTGDAFFPGGMGEFTASMNQFLHFEEGPSSTIHLQWATYMDASDQCSLSRIWGGIHPPIDDIPGRKIGDVVGPQASIMADSIFEINQEALTYGYTTDSLINFSEIGTTFELHFGFSVPMDTSIVPNFTLTTSNLYSAVTIEQYYWLDSNELIIPLTAISSSIEIETSLVQLSNLISGTSSSLPDYSFKDLVLVDTKKPQVDTILSNLAVLNDEASLQETLSLTFIFDELCDTTVIPNIYFSGTNYINSTLIPDLQNTLWLNDSSYQSSYVIQDFNETVGQLDINIDLGVDQNENQMNFASQVAPFTIDTENPIITGIFTADTLITQSDLSNPQTNIQIAFSEAMDVGSVISSQLETNGLLFSSIQSNPGATSWLSNDTVNLNFLLFQGGNDLLPLDLSISNLRDAAGNFLNNSQSDSVLWCDFKSPEVISLNPNISVIADNETGPSNYFIDVTFSENMDTNVVPLILHNAGQSLTGSVQYNVPISSYIDSVTYRAIFQVIDEDIEVSNINVQVSYAQDRSGNILTSFVASDVVTLDTRNPQIIGLFANTSVLNQIGQTWEVIAVYDEQMLQTNAPVIQLSNMSFNFPSTFEAWINSNNYKFEYELTESPAQNTFVDVEIDSGKDIAGNSQVSLLESNYLKIQTVLDLNDIQQEELFLYPNPAKEGDVLILKGLLVENHKIEVDCFNSLGQKLSPISLEKIGENYVSEKISLPKGWYVLKYGLKQFKLIIR